MTEEYRGQERRNGDELAISVLKKLAEIHTDVEVTKKTTEYLKEENDRFRENIIELFNFNRESQKSIVSLGEKHESLKEDFKGHKENHWKVTGLILSVAGMIGAGFSWAMNHLSGKQ